MPAFCTPACRDPEEMSRSVAQAQEQIEASRRAWSRTTVPLSSKGVMLHEPKQWATRWAALEAVAGGC